MRCTCSCHTGEPGFYHCFGGPCCELADMNFYDDKGSLREAYIEEAYRLRAKEKRWNKPMPFIDGTEYVVKRKSDYMTTATKKGGDKCYSA